MLSTFSARVDCWDTRVIGQFFGVSLVAANFLQAEVS